MSDLKRRPDNNALILNDDMLNVFLEMKDVFDQRVDQVFSRYCEMKGIDEAYGVERWDIDGGHIRIRQDTSCKGCYGYENHNLPYGWLTMSDDDLSATMAEIRAKDDADKLRKMKERRKAEIRELSARLERLSEENDDEPGM